MAKRKSNKQKRLISQKQKKHKAQKIENSRKILFRDFSDITPEPKYIIEQHYIETDAYFKEVKRREKSNFILNKKWDEYVLMEKEKEVRSTLLARKFLI